MAGELFGIDIAGIVNDSLEDAGGVLDALLIKVEPGTRTSGSLTSGRNPTERQLRCKGFYDDSKLSRLPETRVQTGDRVAVILGASVPGREEPAPGDKITMDGTTGKVQEIIERDPAAATYVCLVRER